MLWLVIFQSTQPLWICTVAVGVIPVAFDALSRDVPASGQRREESPSIEVQREESFETFGRDVLLQVLAGNELMIGLGLFTRGVSAAEAQVAVLFLE